MVRVRLDLLPQLIDEHAQIFRLIAVIRSPDGLQQSPVRQRLALIRHQVTQQIKFLRRQAHRLSLHRYQPLFEIDLQIVRSKRQERFGRRRAPQRRANPRQQFLVPNGFTT